MKQFFKFMFASMLGFFLTFLIIFFILMGMFFAAISFTKTEEVIVNNNSILHIKLDRIIYDRTLNDPIAFFDPVTFKSKRTLGLNDILKNLKKAQKDDNIKGIYLDLSFIPSGIATIEEIRNALMNFKQSGKFIIAYGETLSQKAYYLATVADKIYLNPEGSIDFRGLAGEVFFLKGMFEKLDIEAQVIQHGKFKSAIEPLILDKMSKANKEQTITFITSIWDKILEAVSSTRNIDITELNKYADELILHNVENAKKYNFIDDLIYKDELFTVLSSKLGIKEIKCRNCISLRKYTHAKVKTDKKKRSRNKIAVIYALGAIESGEGDEKTIGSEKISQAIRKARIDKSVKAIVLRVNSPGGSAIASEVIWREVNLSKKFKPIIVSMGNLAASGGYYISCAADKIIANPTTLTGSIGVFGFIPNFKQFFDKKLGITFDNVKTNDNADFISTVRPLTSFQRSVIKDDVERIYQTFIEHVAEGRKLTTAQVDSIGQGRVWSGVDAKRIGLIDEFGGLEKAIEIAANMAELDDYRIISLPKQKDPFTQIIEDVFGGVQISILEKKLGINYQYYNYLQSIYNMKDVQARLPYEINIY
ncbi:MAG: signal peptide peptidase SppA [Bacteroidales bacterium]|nr:signal peptide peptidase SppA [Bacteroidales bacterium]